ncbi:hypothetical protein Tco_1519709 [Tanacetum coccineum]
MPRDYDGASLGKEGERGFRLDQVMSFALVSSKTHREGCRASCGVNPFQARREGLRAGGEGTSSSPLVECNAPYPFAVMCKAYSGEPSLDLLQAFLNLGPVGDWLTLSNRGGSGIPKALTKPVTHIEGWKGSFCFIENKIVPSKYAELLIE